MTSAQKPTNKNCRGSLAWLGRQTHNLEVGGSNLPLGTKQTQNKPIDNTIVNKNGLVKFLNRFNGKEETYKYGVKPLIEFQRLAKIMCHNDYNDFIALFEDYLTNSKKLDKAVIYEYVRIAKKFVEPLPTVDFSNPKPIVDRISQFLDIENPNSYRNTLASLKHLLEMVSEKELLKDYKYKSIMPTFSVKTPSLEDMVSFGKALTNERIKIYYYLGTVSAIRPEHLLRLRKGLFDRENNMINTFMKTFGKKNFFFSFYTQETKAMIESYLDTITDNNLLFPICNRYIQKEFVKASKKSGIKIVRKTMRKFTTNWLRRHGMIEEDVNVITSHTPQTIIAKHYVDVSRIHEEYNRAMTELKIL